MAKMSGAPGGSFGNAGKKAVHVKWAGKTIALGTFPAAEADEKCARAKALTRAWRSTMRPKPSREWVMVELERLGVRVVSGRLGRKAGDEEDAEKKAAAAAELARTTMPPVDRNNSMGWSTNADLDSLMQRRSSSLGLSLMNDNDKRRSSLGSLGPALGLDAGDPAIPPHRPFVGGGAAAAYEAARADHYAQQQQRRASSLGLGISGGNLGGASAGMQMGLSVNPNQHYEMLKLHHMNLLNEIQETTLMMNLYQQQQIQQQQQQLQQQATTDAQASAEQMTSLLQQQTGVAGAGLDLYGGGAGLSHRGSLGLGTSTDEQQLQLLRQQQILQNGVAAAVGGGAGGPANAAAMSAVANHAAASAPAPSAPAPAATPSAGPGIQDELLKGQQEKAALEKKLATLRKDIARRQKEAEDLEKAATGPNGGTAADGKAGARAADTKRKIDGQDAKASTAAANGNQVKRQKTNGGAGKVKKEK